MLKQLGRLERTRNIIILGFAVLMAVSLVIFYAPGRSATTVNPATSTEVVAKVGSDKVTVADIMLVRESFRQRFGGQISLSQLGGNRSFLESLIAKHVMRQEAERLGLSASDAEVAERIRRQFSDASGAFVGSERYKDSVIPRYGSVEKFENELRDEIAQEKLRAFITSSVNVSDDEVQQEYKRKETSFDVSYVIVSADKLAEKIQPSDADLRTYYDAHKTDLRYLEPQRKVRYLFVDQEKAASKVQVSDQELKAEYDKLAPEFKQAGVKVQQILLKVARKDLDPQVEQKGKDLVAKLRGQTGQVSEQAFADAARGNSEDPATASNGGFLANPVKKNPNKPQALYERAVDMQPGEITDPIRYGGNWYILRRGDPVPKTFEAAKQEILVSLRNRRSYTEALKVATKAYQRLKETKDIQKVAQEVAGEANMAAADMVRETPYIKPGDDVKDIGTNQQFESAVGQLNNPNDIAEPTGIKGGFAIPILVDKKEPRIPEFDEVKTQIADLVKKQRAKDDLEQRAKSLLSSVTSPDALKAAGEKEGFEGDVDKDFKVGSSIGKLEPNAALDEQIFAMKAGEVAKNPVKVGENWVVFGVTKRKDAEMSEFATKRDDVRQTMLSQRQGQVFEDYITAVQQRMKRDGSIKIYEDVLNSIEEPEEPTAAPGLPPGLNFPSKQ
jgi:peptidyl-prolyl cis-trans isomerase D